MAYATISKPSLHFNTKLYTGNGTTTNAQTGVGFQPDFLWLKRRNGSANHFAADVVRGTYSDGYKLIVPNDTDSEQDYTYVKTLDSDGFTLGSTNANVNGNGDTYVGWAWKAGGAGSANTDGATASTVSVNNTAGFSIVKWTGTSGNTTVGHGMNTAPVFTLVKDLGNNGSNWVVYHKDISPDYAVKLNTTNAQSNSNNYWQSTAPTNSLLTFTGNTASNGNGNNMIAYCFAEKSGYSKFGKYTGNGNADGTFIYTGFKPAFAIFKRISGGDNDWILMDNKRDPDNIMKQTLYPNTSGAEAAVDRCDFLSNGIKLRGTSVAFNADGSPYLYIAFAEEPLVANVGQSIPATAK